MFPVELTSYSKEQRLVTGNTPVQVPVCAQSRDGLFARLETTRRGADPYLTAEQAVWEGRHGQDVKV